LKRNITTPITALLALGSSLGLALGLAGCAMVGPADPDAMPAAATPVSDDASATAARDARPDELQNWSRLSKEGREHLMLGRYSAAEQSLLSAFEVSKAFRPRDVRRGVSFGNLELLAAKYQSVHQESSTVRVLAIIAIESADQSAFDYPGLSDLMMTLGDLQSQAEDATAAKASYERAQALRMNKSGATSPTLIDVHRKLAMVAVDLELPEQAVAEADIAIELAETHYDANSSEMVSTRLQAASAYQFAEHHASAQQQYERAIDAQRQIEPSSLTEAVALNGLAFLQLQMEHLPDALTSVDFSLAVLESIEVRGIDRAMILDTKAQILAAQGKSDAADKLFNEVLIDAATASAKDKRVLFESYARFLDEQDRTSDARAIRTEINSNDGVNDAPETASPDAPNADTAGANPASDAPASQTTAEADWSDDASVEYAEPAN
jgi:hypothetical protein